MRVAAPHFLMGLSARKDEATGTRGYSAQIAQGRIRTAGQRFFVVSLQGRVSIGGKGAPERSHIPDGPNAPYALPLAASSARSKACVDVPHFPAAFWCVRTKPPVPAPLRAEDDPDGDFVVLARRFWLPHQFRPRNNRPSIRDGARISLKTRDFC
jgi:hypothetical protein